MVDLEHLAREARRTAEWGRARMALRAGLVIAALTVVSVLAGGDLLMCNCLGLVLFVAVVGLRWWNRAGVDAARLGLAMGAVPLVAAALLPACGVACAPPGYFEEAELVCLIAGVVAGVGLALFADRARLPWRTWMLATGVAGLTAALGCVALGMTGLLVTLAAVVVASATVRLPLQARAG